MRSPSATSSAGGGGNAATSSKRPGCLRAPKMSHLTSVNSITYHKKHESCHSLYLRDIFGSHCHLAMTVTPHLASDSAACCWIPLFALRSELARRPEIASLPVALVAPDTVRTPRVWQVAPLARRGGVKPGMTVSQAIGLCPALKLCEPDPVHYDE